MSELLPVLIALLTAAILTLLLARWLLALLTRPLRAARSQVLYVMAERGEDPWLLDELAARLPFRGFRLLALLNDARERRRIWVEYRLDPDTDERVTTYRLRDLAWRDRDLRRRLRNDSEGPEPEDLAPPEVAARPPVQAAPLDTPKQAPPAPHDDWEPADWDDVEAEPPESTGPPAVPTRRGLGRDR